MDTGLIDSHEDFGINAPKSERIQYRKVATCAPINRKSLGDQSLSRMVPFESQNDTSNGHVGDSIAEYFYGPVLGSGSNATFTYNNDLTYDGAGYMLS